MLHRKLIKDACVITLDKAVGDFARADILVEGDVIAAVGPNIAAEEAEVIDGAGMIAIPGFVDAHRHSWQTTIRNLNSDMTFMQFVLNVNQIYGPLHRPEHKYAGVFASALESIDAGVTTIVEAGISIEGPEDSDAMIAAMRDAGIRGLYCHGVSLDWQKWWVDSVVPHPDEDARRVRQTYFNGDDGLLGFGMSLRGPERTRPEINRRDFGLARDLAAPITLHIDAPGAIESMKEYLGPDTVYVHCCRSTDLDLELIRDSGGYINVTAECEMGLHNAPVTQKVLALGMRPSIGIDGGGTSSSDLFAAMRITLQEVRMRYLADSWEQGAPLMSFPINTRDALEWATIEGARQFGLDGRIGSLTPGKQADIVLIRFDGLHLSPMNHPVAAVVQSASVRDIDTVLIAGKIRKRHGVMVDADLARARRLLYDARDYLFEQAGTPDFCALKQPEPAAPCGHRH
jgi:5-methylthioadenosine/S-adenosylhomocysteine deaminase